MVTWFDTRRRRRTCWIAVLAILAMSWLPTVSHALALAYGPTAWAEVCTPKGLRLVPFAADRADDESPTAPSAAVHLEHCPYCLPSGSALGMPPAWPGRLPLAAIHDGPPLFSIQAPPTLNAWRPAQARAPPAVP